MKTILQTLQANKLTALSVFLLLGLAACSGSDSKKGGSKGSCDGVEAELKDGEEAATIPESFLGKYTLTYAYESRVEGSPYVQGDTEDFEILEDGTLHVGNDITLCNPVHRPVSEEGPVNEHEAIWVDEENDFEFALSDLTRNFNEINLRIGEVYDGQFKKAEDIIEE